MTRAFVQLVDDRQILIHTSVKLVTAIDAIRAKLRWHFNPHEREARDAKGSFTVILDPFNPHEREARDSERLSNS